MKKHKHVFESDGGQCIKCGKTVADLLEEKNQKRIDKIFADRMTSDALGDHSSISSWEESHGRGFWGNATSGYIYDKDNR
jgi:hypothetical protein